MDNIIIVCMVILSIVPSIWMSVLSVLAIKEIFRKNKKTKNMKFYKIINTDKIKIANEFLLEIEDKAEKNHAQAKTITPFEWDKFLVSNASIHLLPIYLGFEPINKIKAPIGWRYDKNYPTALVCDKRTKVGRENIKLLDNLPNYCNFEIYDTLNIEYDITGRFMLPKLFFSDDKKEIYLNLDDKIKLDKSDYLEVTRDYIEEKIKD